MTSPTAAPLIEKGQTILFEGDSLTSRLTPPAHDNWPFLRLMSWHRTYADIMQEWLFCNRPELDLKFRNSAVGGSSAGEILARFDLIVPVVRPNWIIMTTAHNDVARQVPLDQFHRELTTYSTRARQTCGARLAVIGGFLPCPTLPAESMLLRPEMADYYRTARQAAESTGGVWLDIGPSLLAKATLLYQQHPLHTIYSDGGHFNEVGNQIVAFLVLEAMGMLRMSGAA
jgi:lysophospholipase L1-like esterase